MTERIGPWKCFHCNEVFTDPKEAEEHFGKSEAVTTICKRDAYYIREIERQIDLYREEDTVLHRQINELRGRQHLDQQRAEELGYSRGLRDAAAETTNTSTKEDE